MHRESRLWVGLLFMLAVSEGGSNGKHATDDEVHLSTFNGFSPAFPSQFIPKGEPMIKFNSINEKNLAQKGSTTKPNRKEFFEENPWKEIRNIAMHLLNFNAFLNGGILVDEFERAKIDSNEHLTKNRWLPSLTSNVTWDNINTNLSVIPDVFIREFKHGEFITETMLFISHSFEKLGLTNNCLMPSATTIHHTTSELAHHIFLNISHVTEMPWIDKNHPVGKHIRKITEDAPQIKKKCSSPLNYQNIKNHFEQLVTDIDDDLKIFLTKKLTPIVSYLSTNGRNMIVKILPILFYLCVNTFGTKGRSTQQCAKDLTHLCAKALGEEDIPLEVKSKLIRYKRFTDTTETEESVLVPESSSPQATIQDIEKSGSYGGGGYGGYDEPNIVFIPGEGDDVSYPLILKFLGILVIGTYVFLGLLVAHTLFGILLYGFWPRGRKGDRGPSGPKGILGDKGMKGLKGMKGETGPTGPDGPAGMIGDPGEDGEAGQPGDDGVPGEDGDKGMKGNKGPKGMKAPAGEKGETGDKGDRGMKGNKGLSGREKRELSHLTSWKSTVNVVDAPNLLKLLYQKEDQINRQERERDAHLIVTRINNLWREFKNPSGCLRCALFECLESLPDDSLDSYVVAGFAHVLGDAGSLQLVEHVREAKKKMLSIRCRRRKTSCRVEFVNKK